MPLQDDVEQAHLIRLDGVSAISRSSARWINLKSAGASVRLSTIGTVVAVVHETTSRHVFGAEMVVVAATIRTKAKRTAVQSHLCPRSGYETGHTKRPRADESLGSRARPWQGWGRLVALRLPLLEARARVGRQHSVVGGKNKAGEGCVGCRDRELC